MDNLEQGLAGSNEVGDAEAFQKNVPPGAKVAARLNDTLDGVRLRYRSAVYEIPKEKLQSGLHYKFNTFMNVRLGAKLKTEIVLDAHGRFGEAREGQQARNVWSWKPEIEQAKKQLTDLVIEKIVEANQSRKPDGFVQFLAGFVGVRPDVSASTVRREVEATLFPPALVNLLQRSPVGTRERIQDTMAEKIHNFLTNDLSKSFERKINGHVAMSAIAFGCYIRDAMMRDVPIARGLIALPLMYAVAQLGQDPSNYVKENVERVVENLIKELTQLEAASERSSRRSSQGSPAAYALAQMRRSERDTQDQGAGIRRG
jgi:hypothetical protein